MQVNITDPWNGEVHASLNVSNQNEKVFQVWRKNNNKRFSDHLFTVINSTNIQVFEACDLF